MKDKSQMPIRLFRLNTSSGGRVLNVTARGRSVAAAQARAYRAIAAIDWPGGFCRHDIGWRAIEREGIATSRGHDVGPGGTG